MRYLLTFLTFLGLVLRSAAQVCDPAGNLFLVSNYNGGIVTINVDQNIPNLVIGISTYEPVQVTLTGPFVANVVQVLYAGMNSSQGNNNCGQGNFTTTVSGVPASLVTINPPMTPPQVGYTPQHNNGTGSWGGVVIGAIGICDTLVNTGGVNTPDELVFHFETQTGASLYAHYSQYACWQNSTINVSGGGTCCIDVTPPSTACTIGPVAVQLSAPTCAGASDGALSTLPAGTGPYTYAWSTTPPQIGPTATGLSVGTYTVIIDAGGACDTTLTLTLTDPPALSLTLSGDSTVCAGESTQLDALVTGGSGTVQVTWDTGITGTSLALTPTASTPHSATATDSNGCTTQSTVQVVVFPVPSVSILSATDTACAGTAVNFTAQSIGADAYQWVLGSAGTSNSNSAQATYSEEATELITLIGVSAEGCSSALATSTLEVLPNPEVDLVIEPLPCSESALVTAETPGESIWTVSVNGTMTSVPSGETWQLTLAGTGSQQVLVEATNAAGCVGTAFASTVVRPNVGTYLPNVFSPNGDGINDTFGLLNLDPASAFELRVFDRWGVEVFTTTDPSRTWDGSAGNGEAPEGVYVFVLDADDLCGSRTTTTRSGHVTLLR